jgi:hypothetical protein
VRPAAAAAYRANLAGPNYKHLLRRCDHGANRRIIAEEDQHSTSCRRGEARKRGERREKKSGQRSQTPRKRSEPSPRLPAFALLPSLPHPTLRPTPRDSPCSPPRHLATSSSTFPAIRTGWGHVNRLYHWRSDYRSQP